MKKFLNLRKKKNELVKQKTGVLCTISSGQDSMSTFLILLHTKKKFLINLKIIYCHHFWQTKNFLSIRLLYKLSFLFEVPYTVIFPQNLLINENHSREWRKKNFCRVAKFQNLFHVITGQTLTDNLEKFFTNLLRGTTPKGVSESNLLNYKKTTGFFFSILILKPIQGKYRFIKKKKLFKQKNTKFSKILKKKNLSFFTTQYFFSKNLSSPYRKIPIFCKSQKKIKSLSKSIVRLLLFNSKKIVFSQIGSPKTLFGESQGLKHFGTTCYWDQVKAMKLNPLNVWPKRNFDSDSGFNQKIFYFLLTNILKKNPTKKKYLNFLRNQKRNSQSFCIYSKTVELKLLSQKPIPVPVSKTLWSFAQKEVLKQDMISKTKLSSNQKFEEREQSFCKKIQRYHKNKFLPVSFSKTKLVSFSKTKFLRPTSFLRPTPFLRVLGFGEFGEVGAVKGQEKETNYKLAQNFLSQTVPKQSFGNGSKNEIDLFLKNDVFETNAVFEKENGKKKGLTRFTNSKLIKFYNFPLITDVTNFSSNFSRNKIRHQIFPLIRYLFNTKFEFLIDNFLQTLDLEQKLVEKEIQEILFLLKTKKKLKKQDLKVKKFRIKKFKKFKLTQKTQNSLKGQERLFIQQIFADYTDIELTQYQTRKLQNLVNTQKLFFIIGLPGTRTRN